MNIVAIGGTTRSPSSTETALSISLEAVRGPGVQCRLFGASELPKELYDPDNTRMDNRASDLISAVRAADGVILASPGYHGGVSGLVKNALDYLEEIAKDDRPYLHGLPVGCISVAYGYQAANATLRSLRDIAHALRGWPTAYGAALHAGDANLSSKSAVNASCREQLALVSTQVVDFVRQREAETAPA